MQRLLQGTHIEGGFVQLNQSPDDKGVIVHMRRNPRHAIPEPMQQSPVRCAAILHEEVHGVLRRRRVLGIVEHLRRLRQRGDHQAVPIGENLVVLVRMNPLLTHFEQPGAD